MLLNSYIATALTTFVGFTIAAPMNHVRQNTGGIPFFTPSGGPGQAQLIIGGGILPTATIGAALGGQGNQIAFGVSNTVGVGGGPFPTALVGFGAGAGLDPNNIIIQASATASEGGWLNGAIPTLQAGAVVNGNFGYKSSSGNTIVAGANGGGWGTLGYGGIFIPSSTLAISAGANFGVNIHNGAVTPTSTP
ncbi:hypothetical protein LPJ64_000474 [Coemansia asiatica]|uniref:Uncharacterized protein n=1 Tax=Coemansia asiatica TaxID=1052880 RepID=A0A9W7XQA8_9FUNG|nr:hypothetical protein LPJ64_000474 [Coemansia asiatica]